MCYLHYKIDTFTTLSLITYITRVTSIPDQFYWTQWEKNPIRNVPKLLFVKRVTPWCAAMCFSLLKVTSICCIRKKNNKQKKRNKVECEAHGKNTYERHTDDIRVHTSDIRMTYEYIRVIYGGYNEWHKDDIRLHTSDKRMTCE